MFSAQDGFQVKLVPFLAAILVVSFYTTSIENDSAEYSENRYKSSVNTIFKRMLREIISEGDQIIANTILI